MGLVAQGGTVVTYGTRLGAEATFDVRHFFLAGSAELYGFFMENDETVKFRAAREKEVSHVECSFSAKPSTICYHRATLSDQPHDVSDDFATDASDDQAL